MKKNNITVIARSVALIVFIDEYKSGDFSLTIDDDGNSTKILVFGQSDIDRCCGSNVLCVVYKPLYDFTLESLKIKCKYPVKVRCDDFRLGFVVPKLEED